MKTDPLVVFIFLLFIGLVLGISFYLGRKARDARVLRRPRRDSLADQRNCLRRGLPLGGVVPWHLRNDRLLRV